MHLYKITVFSTLLFLLLCGAAHGQQLHTDSLFSVISRSDSDSVKATAYGQLFKHYYDFSPDTTERIYHEFQSLGATTTSPFVRAMAGINAGEWYYRRGNAEAGTAILLETLTLTEQYEETLKRQKAMVLGLLGNINFLTDNFEGARSYYSKSVHFIERNNLKLYDESAKFLSNIGATYHMDQNYDSALYYYEKGVEFAREIGNKARVAATVTNIAMIYSNQGEHQKAIDFQNQALEVYKENNNKIGMVYSYRSIGQAESRLGHYKTAFKLADTAIQLALESKVPRLIRDTYEVATDIYAEAEKHKEALDHFYNYKIYNDSILQEQQQDRINELQTRYETEKKELEISNLKEVQALQASALEAQKKQNIYLLILAGAMLAIGWLTFYFYKQIKKSKQQLEKQNHTIKVQYEELQKLNATKDRFFAIIAHDLRNPVTSFQGISRLIKSYVEKKKLEKLESLSEKIDHSVGTLNQLLDNLLNWAVSQTGTLPYHPELISVQQLIRENFELFTEAAESKNIRLLSTLEEDIPLYADKNGVNTILRNLIGNALKFTPESGEIRISAKKEGEKVTIMTSDNGVGMDQNKAKTLFEVAVNESTRGTNGEKGTGLGLVLCRDFAELNNGKIWVESQVEKGTTFYLSLPSVQQQQAA